MGESDGEGDADREHLPDETDALGCSEVWEAMVEARQDDEAEE